jgi:hypothetical protein
MVCECRRIDRRRRPREAAKRQKYVRYNGSDGPIREGWAGLGKQSRTPRAESQSIEARARSGHEARNTHRADMSGVTVGGERERRLERCWSSMSGATVGCRAGEIAAGACRPSWSARSVSLGVRVWGFVPAPGRGTPSRKAPGGSRTRCQARVGPRGRPEVARGSWAILGAGWALAVEARFRR